MRRITMILATILVVSVLPSASAEPMSADCDIAGVIVDCDTAAPVRGTNEWRTWKVAYNPRLGKYEAAVPNRYRVGDHLKIVYKGRSVKVKVIDTGPYFDVSTWAMNRLASTSVGVIRAKVKRI